MTSTQIGLPFELEKVPKHNTAEHNDGRCCIDELLSLDDLFVHSQAAPLQTHAPGQVVRVDYTLHC
jgi:hypothetical protein